MAEAVATHEDEKLAHASTGDHEWAHLEEGCSLLQLDGDISVLALSFGFTSPVLAPEMGGNGFRSISVVRGKRESLTIITENEALPAELGLTALGNKVIGLASHLMTTHLGVMRSRSRWIELTRAGVINEVHCVWSKPCPTWRGGPFGPSIQRQEIGPPGTQTRDLLLSQHGQLADIGMKHLWNLLTAPVGVI